LTSTVGSNRATTPSLTSLDAALIIPGYNPRQPLAKDSNLAQAAGRYKIDTTKLADEVRTELAKKKEKQEAGKAPAKTQKAVKPK
jgi:hypothetical protein